MNFKILKFVTFVSFFYSSLLFGNQANIKFTQLEKEYLEQHRVLKAHNETNWPPFNFNENGVAKGYSIDYMNLLASKIGIEIDYISGYNWSEYMTMLQTDNLDVIINISKNEERSKTISFSDVFLSVKNAIYVNVHNQDINSIEDLKGKTIVMPKGFFAQKFIEKNYPEIKQILVNDQLQALKILSLEKADATIGKKIVLDFIIQNNLISNVLATQYVEDDKLISHMRIGASQKDKIISDILIKAQKYVTKEEKDALQFKWFGAKMKNEYNNKTVLTNKEKKYLEKKQHITMCVDPNWMPFEKIEKGKHIGLSSDFIQVISKKIDTPFTLIHTSSWDESLQKAKNRVCDILPMASITPSRKKYLNFTTPYHATNLVIATKTNEIYLNNLDNNLDKRFAVVKGYSLEETLKIKYPDIILVPVDSVHEALNKVHEGKVFGYLDNAVTIIYEIQKNFLGTISIVGRSPDKREYRIASRNDEEILNTILQKAIDSMSTNELDLIKNKWLNYKQDILIDYSLIWKIVLFSGFVILVLMLFLRKQNKLKQEIEHLNENLQETINEEVEKSRKKDQTIFKQAKLVNMGEMIGNISHQWRQPLAEINSIVMKIDGDFAMKKLDKNTLDINLIKIENLTEYMSNTIENFNNFFKIDKERKTFMIASVVKKVINLFDSSFKMHHINIETKIIDDCNITTYEGEFIQVLIILLQNSKDAFLVNNITDAKIEIIINCHHDKINLQMIDNAGGVPLDIMEKIFDPYFTTKFKSQGIGIGLYMAKMIIEKNMSGTLDVNNNKNGASFTIELPYNI